MKQSIIDRLDKIASDLQDKGRLGLAIEIDKVSNAIDYSNIFNNAKNQALVQEITNAINDYGTGVKKLLKSFLIEVINLYFNKGVDLPDMNQKLMQGLVKFELNSGYPGAPQFLLAYEGISGDFSYDTSKVNSWILSEQPVVLIYLVAGEVTGTSYHKMRKDKKILDIVINISPFIGLAYNDVIEDFNKTEKDDINKAKSFMLSAIDKSFKIFEINLVPTITHEMTHADQKMRDFGLSNTKNKNNDFLEGPNVKNYRHPFNDNESEAVRAGAESYYRMKEKHGLTKDEINKNEIDPNIYYTLFADAASHDAEDVRGVIRCVEMLERDNLSNDRLIELVDKYKKFIFDKFEKDPDFRKRFPKESQYLSIGSLKYLNPKNTFIHMILMKPRSL